MIPRARRNALRRDEILGRDTQIGSEKRQLLVDISTLYRHDAHSGIQRLVRGELNRLMHEPPEGFVVHPVAATRQVFYRYVEWPKRHSPVSSTNPVRVQPGDVFYGLDLSAHIIPVYLPQLIEWKQRGVRFDFVIYDLIPLQNPGWFSGKLVAAFRRWIKVVAILADSVTCISHVVENDFSAWVQDRFGLAKSDIPTSLMTIPGDLAATSPSTGLSPNFPLLLEQIRQRETALMVGTIEPRKGHVDVLEAFQMLWSRGCDCNLVIVGRPGWKTRALQQRLRRHPELDRRLFWVDDASDEALAALYRACNGVIVASYAEGLGLPLIEALNYAKPVLVRDLPVFREMGGTSSNILTFPFKATRCQLADSIAEFLGVKHRLMSATGGCGEASAARMCA